ncbi:hypothetical protein L9F63_021506 [Diploptera punctata]|uniref:Major facilitator superfamily (MFS) profile domain-containing protein n=1 Tax=Diploptera punctata TaxID=6984 RepID=A0AAD8EBN5_DIPPU|nr:hypothetical protein L9F63_021506 [Diploptera punctata]
MASASVDAQEQHPDMEDVGATHLFITNSENSQTQKKSFSESETESSCCLLKISIPVRVQIGIMAFFMFFVTQMMRSNLYIAHIGMTNTVNYSSLENSSTSDKIPKRVDWSEQETAVVFSAFYWCYWITELPGGMLAEKFGARRVLGIAVMTAGAVNLVFPLACNVHFILAAALRAIQGLALGVTWPATHVISAHWIPSTERSKFMTTYHGSSVGTALTYPLSGLLMSVLNWESVFYMTGLLTLLWSAGWWQLVYDRPSEHPHISSRERKYLQKAIGNSVSSDKKSLRTPWSSILCSGPFWAVLLASQGLMWGTITLSMQVPAYFKHVYSLDIKMNGFLSGIPEFCKFVFSILFSTLIDYLLRNKYLTVTTARKIAVAISEFLPAIFLVVLAYFGIKTTVGAVVLLALISAVGGASSSGSLANVVDLSPNFAGTLLGIIKTLTLVPGVLSPNLVSIFSDMFGHFDCWYYVFITMAAIYATCGTIFILLGSGEVQPWNNPEFRELHSSGKEIAPS